MVGTLEQRQISQLFESTFGDEMQFIQEQRQKRRREMQQQMRKAMPEDNIGRNAPPLNTVPSPSTPPKIQAAPLTAP